MRHLYCPLVVGGQNGIRSVSSLVRVWVFFIKIKKCVGPNYGTTLISMFLIDLFCVSFVQF